MGRSEGAMTVSAYADVRMRQVQSQTQRWAFACACAGVSLLALAACGPRTALTPPPSPAFVVKGDLITVPEGSPLRQRLTVEAVETADIAQDVAAPAVVEADPARQHRIFAPLTGQVVRLDARLGERVRAGQALALLASPDLSAAVSEDARARAQLRLAGAAQQRAGALKDIGGVADKEIEQAQAEYAGAAAEAERTAARLRQVGAAARTRDGRFVLTAPAAGVVTDLAVAPGAFWGDATAALMTVSDISTVWVVASVAETDVGAIREGQPVTVSFIAYPDAPLAGRVQSIGALLDPDTRRVKVRIAVSNPTGRYKPGMFASVRFAAPHKAEPAAPTTALVFKNDATSVFAEVAPWTFQRRVVETGAEQGGRTLIALGLAAGQRIVSKGGVLIND
jgi:cobalt-zinc-cadmium efflux system membrane fusion protein